MSGDSGDESIDHGASLPGEDPVGRRRGGGGTACRGRAPTSRPAPWPGRPPRRAGRRPGRASAAARRARPWPTPGSTSVSSCSRSVSHGSQLSMPSNSSALAEALPLLAAPRLGADELRRPGPARRRWGSARGPGRCSASARSSVERWSLTPKRVRRSTSSPHRSMRIGLVAGRREDVDDRAPAGELAAVLDELLAAVAELGEPGDELVGVDDVARAHDDRLDRRGVGAEPLQQRPDAGDDDRRACAPGRAAATAARGAGPSSPPTG